MPEFPVYIGWDPTEEEAWRVCAASLKEHSSVPLRIERIGEQEHGFDRLWHYEEKQRIDIVDGTPFSTGFSFARFLVPHICKEPWALFLDCDFLVQGDVRDLIALADPKFAVMVVKHRHIPREALKMNGVEQTRYERKNWSSLVLWNLSHPSTKFLTLQDVNSKPGWWLHGFRWLKDKEIGELPMEWNYLVGYYPERPKALHYTLGGPWFESQKKGPFAQEWLEARKRLR